MIETHHLPYGQALPSLLAAIIKALSICVKKSDNREPLDPTDAEFTNCFRDLKNLFPSGKDRHITRGLQTSHITKLKTYPRLSKLTIQAFNESLEITKSPSFKGSVLPSPLRILYQALTIPDEPQTAAYALATCRGLLYSNFHVHPDVDTNDSKFDDLKPEFIQDAISTFNHHIDIQARWPKDVHSQSIQTRANLVVGHYLAMKGAAVLWFNSSSLRCKFLNSKNWLKPPTYRFRLSPAFSKLPDSSEVINEMIGIPLPVRGAEVIFFGGLRKAHNSSLVMSISGGAGSGKTSFALALAAILAPLNTKCLYFSLEEGVHDLWNRLNSLIPDYLRNSSIFELQPRPAVNSRISGWFTPVRLKTDWDIENFGELILKKLSPPTMKQNNDDTMPAICPALVVIDNITGLLLENSDQKRFFHQLEEFIRICRKLRSLVILISGDNLADAVRLDYLTDISLKLLHERTKEVDTKPHRVIQLIKTRHQISRQGSHIFHLSRSAGFRIYPQVPSHIDLRERIRRLLPDEQNLVHRIVVSNESQDRKTARIFSLSLFRRSHILIHGVGSSGKAGFALRLLMTPSSEITLAGFPRTNVGLKHLSDHSHVKTEHKRKLLIVSFLYPEDYYNSLVKNYITSRRAIRDEIHCIAFYPGFLLPEDVISKITRKLDGAILHGEPFTGILLDGLHNVFLQFTELQKRDMVWPLVYNILSRYDLTVVTTFTTFSVDDRDSTLSREQPNNALLREQQAPFLHALVQATDFFLSITQEIVQGRRSYHIQVKSAIKQPVPSEVLVWDRDSLQIIGLCDSNGTEYSPKRNRTVKYTKAHRYSSR